MKSNARHARPAATEALTRLVGLGVRLNSERQPGRLGPLVSAETEALLGARRVLLLHDTPQGPRITGERLPRGEDAALLLQAIAPWLAEARQTLNVALRHGPAGADAAAQRSCLVAPLVLQHKLLGFLYADVDGLFGRFDAAERDLFALLVAQVAVALDNAQWAQGLQAEVAEHRAELAAALGEKAAISDVLEVISRSTFDLDLVLRTLIENATRLCDADFGVMFRPDDSGNFLPSASHNVPPGFLAALQAKPIRAGDGSLTGRVLLEKRVLQIEDLHREAGYRRDLAGAASFHSMLSVPLLRHGEIVLVLTIARGGASRRKHDVPPRSESHR